MEIVWLAPDYYGFPDPALSTDENGIIALGGDFHCDRLLNAYKKGIFPWPHDNYPLLWFCPDPRFVLEPKNFYRSKSLKKLIRQERYRISFDEDFERVIENCSKIKREGQRGTWIIPEMIDAYINLHYLGYAHSVEVWEANTLVGGLYGLCLGHSFFGESMFAKKRDTSKLAFSFLAEKFIDWGYDFIDCQAHTTHLESLGAKNISRAVFLAKLKDTLTKETLVGSWKSRG